MNFRLFVLFFPVFLSFNIIAQEANLKTYLDSASLYQLSGDTMEVHYLTKAIALQPSNPTLYELRAYAKSKIPKDNKGKFGADAAIKDLDTAIKLRPKNSILFEQRGYQKFLVKNYYQSLKDYNKAIRYDKKNASAYRKRGDLFWEVESFTNAGNDYYRAASLDTSGTYNLRKVADCFYELGNFYNATKYYDKVIEKLEARESYKTEYEEDYVLALLYKANSLGQVGEIREAIENYSKVIDYNEKMKGIIDYTQEAFRFRGMAKLQVDKKKEGCEDLNAALSLGDKEASEYIDHYCK